MIVKGGAALYWQKFYSNLQKDYKLIFCTWIYLNLLRIIAIVTMKQYAGNIEATDILWTVFYGARMSLKTAGVLMLFSVLLVTLPCKLWKYNTNKFRMSLTAIFMFITNFLFVAKFYYYKEFHTSYNEMVFNAFNDDLKALIYTFIEEYHLIPAVIGVAIFTAIIVYLFNKLVNKAWIKGSCKYQNRWWYKVIIVLLTLLFALFTRFGASFSYAHSIHWENCAKTKDSFLNEMILDDMQAMYRGYSIKQRIDNGIIYGVDKTKIKDEVAFLAGYSDAKSLGKEDLSQIDSNLVYQAQGNKVKNKQHIFIIIGESFAQWPLLDEYAYLHLGDNMRELMQQPNSAYTHNFMPNGAFTPMAVNAVICGLSDVNIYPNHQLESYRQVYKTALAPQLKKLGYKTEFWYSGFSGWERIKDFALAQGFDSFHCASDYQYPSGNVWGADDDFIFDKLKEEVDRNYKPTVYVILSVSNHAPYSVDLTKEGFPKEEVRAKLPDKLKHNDELLNRLGHYWYTDKVFGDFVRDIEAQYPKQNLFIITGDHANRTNLEDKPTLFNQYTIPFIVYGDGITKDLLSDKVAGGQINLGATLFELIAPKDFEYYSLGKSLTRGADVGFNDIIWLTPNGIGQIDGSETAHVKQILQADRTISWWRSIKGNNIQ